MEETREWNLDEISPRSVCVDILKNIWFVLLAAAAAWFAVTGAQKLVYVPEYTATATLAVNARGSSTNVYSSLTLTTQMASVFSEVFDSNVLRERIQEDLGVDSIEGEISSTIIEETNLIVLTVTSVNPRQTYLIIRSALDNYDTVSDYLFSNAVLRTVQEPTVPYSPSNVRNISRVRRLAMLGAAAVVVMALALFSLMRFTVKTPEGAKRNLDGRILGQLPYLKKRKKKKAFLITTPLVSMEFSEAVRKAATALNHHMRRREQKVILLTSVGENEGKSTVAANLALALAEKKKKVALIDLDLKKPAQYRIFDRPNTGRKYFTEYLSGQASLREVLAYNNILNLYTIFQDTGVRNSGNLIGNDRMKALLDSLRKTMDYIVLDSPPMAFSSDAELMMRQVDVVTMVVRQDWTDIRAINDAADEVRKNQADFAGYVLNAFHRDFSLQERRGYGRYYQRERGGAFSEE